MPMVAKLLVAAVVAAVCVAARAAPVDANRGTQAELESVSGLGPSLVSKIIDERRRGAFKDWQDLIARVGGIGPGNAAKFSAEGLTVNGVGYRGANTGLTSP